VGNFAAAAVIAIAIAAIAKLQTVAIKNLGIDLLDTTVLL